MATYAIYTRTKEGAISRAADVFNWEGPLGPYMHEEPLVGWPESKVFWIYKTGYSIGLAPMFASPQSPPKPTSKSAIPPAISPNMIYV